MRRRSNRNETLKIQITTGICLNKEKRQFGFFNTNERISCNSRIAGFRRIDFPISKGHGYRIYYRIVGHIMSRLKQQNKPAR